MADFDNDGDNDVLSSSIGGNKIVWYENLTMLGVAETLQQKISMHPNPDNNLITSTGIYAIKQIIIYNLFGN